MTKLRAIVAAAAACALLPITAVHAQAGDASAKARTILQEAGAVLAKHESFVLVGTLTYHGEFGGDSEIEDTDYTVAFQRPSTVSVHALNRDVDVYFYGNGKELTRYVPEFSQYVTEPDTSSPADVVAMSGFEMIAPALKVMSELVNTDPFGGKFTAQDLAYVGTDIWKDYECDVIGFTSGDYAYKMWIEQKPERLVRRIEPDMAPLEGKYTEQYGMKFDIQVAAELTKWDLGADVSKQAQFSPPEGVEKVAAFQPPRQITPAEQMVGEEAPDFTIPLLDGGELTLSSERGHVVILDFWATWCGPCRMAMPALEQVSKEFAGKGVKLFGVNLQESPDQIKSYLKSEGLDVTVALDRDGSIADLYKVQGIPQTVFVGPDGKVAIVHVGLWAMPTEQPAETAEGQTKQIHEALVEQLREELNGLTSASSAESH